MFIFNNIRVDDNFIYAHADGRGTTADVKIPRSGWRDTEITNLSGNRNSVTILQGCWVLYDMCCDNGWKLEGSENISHMWG